jgi:hypothetical protein
MVEPTYLDHPAFNTANRGPVVPGASEPDPSPAQIRRRSEIIFRTWTARDRILRRLTVHGERTAFQSPRWTPPEISLTDLAALEDAESFDGDSAGLVD